MRWATCMAVPIFYKGAIGRNRRRLQATSHRPCNYRLYWRLYRQRARLCAKRARPVTAMAAGALKKLSFCAGIMERSCRVSSPIQEAWTNGGDTAVSETLLSYGLQPCINPDRHEQIRLAIEFADILPKEHLDFLDSLELSFSCGDFLFVHAWRASLRSDRRADGG